MLGVGDGVLALRILQADFEEKTWRACWETVAAGRPAADVASELGLTVGAVYAAKFRSSPGKKDGLYWPTKAGEPQSPLGPLVAQAVREGYGAGGAKTTGPVAYHGYYYRILTSQGKDAPGGAFNYVVNGKLFGGFAVVAWPASYGNSGVKSFLVNHEGIVYEKDLGADSAAAATKIKAFDPSDWKKVP